MTDAQLARPALKQQVRGFFALAEKTARAKLIYRLSTAISFVAGGLGYVVFLLVWLEVYRSGSANPAVSKQAMIPYLTLAFILNSTLMLSVEMRFLARLRQGLITSDLLRPLGFMPQQLAQGLGDVAINLLLALPLCAAGYYFLGASLLPASSSALLLGSLSALLALLINFAISYLLVQASFVMSSGYGILTTRAALHQVMSGLAAPLVMFPAALREVALWLPFRHVVETPVTLWLGHVAPEQVASTLIAQLAWAVGLLALGMLLFSGAVARHQVQGG